jgi:hypothetical protein
MREKSITPNSSAISVGAISANSSMALPFRSDLATLPARRT